MKLDTDPMHIRMFCTPSPPSMLFFSSYLISFTAAWLNIIEYLPIKLVSSDKVAVDSF